MPLYQELATYKRVIFAGLSSKVSHKLFVDTEGTSSEGTGPRESFGERDIVVAESEE